VEEVPNKFELVVAELVAPKLPNSDPEVDAGWLWPRLPNKDMLQAVTQRSVEWRNN
jgi:hypothetical protein